MFNNAESNPINLKSMMAFFVVGEIFYYRSEFVLCFFIFPDCFDDMLTRVLIDLSIYGSLSGDKCGGAVVVNGGCGGRGRNEGEVVELVV